MLRSMEIDSDVGGEVCVQVCVVFVHVCVCKLVEEVIDGRLSLPLVSETQAADGEGEWARMMSHNQCHQHA